MTESGRRYGLTLNPERATIRSTYQELPHMSGAAARSAGELITQLVRPGRLQMRL